MARLRIDIALLLILLSPAVAGAQELFVNVGENFMTTARPIMKFVMEPRRFQTVDVGIFWKTSDTETARLYGFPRFGIGFSYANLSPLECRGSSRMGDSYALYMHLDREFLQWGIFSAGYNIEYGIGLMTHYYDRYENYWNKLYGGPIANHAELGLFSRLQVSEHLAFRAEVNYRHKSSGRLYVPNSGLNAISCALGVHYAVGEHTLKPGGRRPAEDLLDKRFRVAVFAGGGVHRCMAEFKADFEFPKEERQPSYTPWFKGSVGAEVNWRYARRTATGVQMEFFYLSNTEALRRADDILYGPAERKYSPFAAGIGLTQDLYYGSFTAGVGVGAYLFRQVGQHEDHGRLYQKVTLRYFPPALKRVFAGIAIRTHLFSQADYMELSIGTIL